MTTKQKAAVMGALVGTVGVVSYFVTPTQPLPPTHYVTWSPSASSQIVYEVWFKTNVTGVLLPYTNTFSTNVGIQATGKMRFFAVRCRYTNAPYGTSSWATTKR